MRARSVPLGTMFGWIPATFRLVAGNFGAMAVATILTLLAGLLVALPMLFVLFKSMKGLGSPGVPLPQDMTGFWVAYGICIVASLVLMPPLLAGWFRLCASADRGHAVSGTQVLQPYRDSAAWLRLLVFILLGTLAYAVVIGVMFLLFRGAFTEIVAMQAAQQAALATGAAPPPPSMAVLGQVFLMYTVLLPTLFVLQFIYMVGLAEVALRPTSGTEAFAEAAGGVLRNLVKLLLLMFVVGMLSGIVVMILAVVVGLLAFALSFVSQVLMAAVVAICYLALILAIYPLMFAGNYFVWKDMLGGETVADTGGAVAA